MRKARRVEIPEVISYKEYSDYSEHLHNSAMWYIFNAPKSTNALRKKFIEKGYPTGTTRVEKKSGEIEEHNFIEEEIEKLVRGDLLDDYALAESIAKKVIRSGKGPNVVRSKLCIREFPLEVSQEIVNNLDSSSYRITEAFNRVKRSSAYRKADSEYNRKSVTYQKLIAAGYSYGDIEEWMLREDLFDEFG